VRDPCEKTDLIDLPVRIGVRPMAAGLIAGRASLITKDT
jgi:hypothetical protein